MTILQALRIYGPCDAFVVQDKTGKPLDSVVNALWDLRCDGFVCSTTGTDWDVTETGRRAFSESLRPQPRRVARGWRLGRAS